VTEIDLMLQTMWDNYQVSPTTIFVNSQQLKDITNRALGNTSNAPLIQMQGATQSEFMAGNVVDSYFNPFASNGGYKIPIRVHPTLPAGTILGWCDNLPVQYQQQRAQRRRDQDPQGLLPDRVAAGHTRASDRRVRRRGACGVFPARDRDNYQRCGMILAH
jgi:hypothetical protein